MRIYNHGTTVRLVARFEHQGRPVDPPTVSLHIKAPGRDWERLEHGKSRILKRPEAGQYLVELPTIDSGSPGIWRYAWTWSGIGRIQEPDNRHTFSIRHPEELDG